MRRKKQKQLRRVDDIHKPRPFLRFLGAVLLFFAVSMVACLIYYMILANADASYVITG